VNEGIPIHGDVLMADFVYLTWNDLLIQLQEMSAEELSQNATIYMQGLDEFYPVIEMGRSKDGDAADGILDHGHVYLEVDG